jgi:hypothetical protein
VQTSAIQDLNAKKDESLPVTTLVAPSTEEVVGDVPPIGVLPVESSPDAPKSDDMAEMRDPASMVSNLHVEHRITSVPVYHLLKFKADVVYHREKMDLYWEVNLDTPMSYTPGAVHIHKDLYNLYMKYRDHYLGMAGPKSRVRRGVDDKLVPNPELYSLNVYDLRQGQGVTVGDDAILDAAIQRIGNIQDPMDDHARLARVPIDGTSVSLHNIAANILLDFQNGNSPWMPYSDYRETFKDMGQGATFVDYDVISSKNVSEMNTTILPALRYSTFPAAGEAYPPYKQFGYANDLVSDYMKAYASIIEGSLNVQSADPVSVQRGNAPQNLIARSPMRKLLHGGLSKANFKAVLDVILLKLHYTSVIETELKVIPMSPQYSDLALAILMRNIGKKFFTAIDIIRVNNAIFRLYTEGDMWFIDNGQREPVNPFVWNNREASDGTRDFARDNLAGLDPQAARFFGFLLNADMWIDFDAMTVEYTPFTVVRTSGNIRVDNPYLLMHRQRPDDYQLSAWYINLSRFIEMLTQGNVGFRERSEGRLLLELINMLVGRLDEFVTVGENINIVSETNRTLPTFVESQTPGAAFDITRLDANGDPVVNQEPVNGWKRGLTVEDLLSFHLLAMSEGLAKVDVRRLIEGVFVTHSLQTCLVGISEITRMELDAIDDAIAVSADPNLLRNDLYKLDTVVKEFVIPQLLYKDDLALSMLDSLLSRRSMSRKMALMFAPRWVGSEYQILRSIRETLWLIMRGDNMLYVTRMGFRPGNVDRDRATYRLWPAPAQPQQILNVLGVRDQIRRARPTQYDIAVTVGYSMTKAVSWFDTSDNVDDYIKVTPGAGITENVNVIIHGPLPIRYERYENEIARYTAYSASVREYVIGSSEDLPPADVVCNNFWRSNVLSGYNALEDVVPLLLEQQPLRHLRNSVKFAPLVVPKFL